MTAAYLSLAVCLVFTLLVHELAHAAAAAAFGLPWTPTLTRHGPGVRIGSDNVRLTRAQVSWTAAAGPAANIIFAFVAFRASVPMLVLVNAEFALFNLLPFRRSDGRRILRGQEAS